MSNQQLDLKFPKFGVFGIILLIVGVIFLTRSLVTVGAGEAGVLYRPLAGGVVIDYNSSLALMYNKENLRNPYFLVIRKELIGKI